MKVAVRFDMSVWITLEVDEALVESNDLADHVAPVGNALVDDVKKCVGVDLVVPDAGLVVADEMYQQAKREYLARINAPAHVEEPAIPEGAVVMPPPNMLQ